MAKISIDIPKNLENSKPKARPPRRYSTGNSTVIPSEPDPLPNYLRASIGSCHDFCKYGIKRDFQTKKTPPPSPQPDKNENTPQKERSEKYQIGGKLAAKSRKFVAAPPRQWPKQKPSGTNTSNHRQIVKQGNKTSLKSSSNVRISRNDANKDTRTSKISEKSDFLPSSVKASTPTNETRKSASQLEIKKSAGKSDTDQRERYENVVPEKIIHVIELKDENRNEDLAPAENQNEDLAPAENQNEDLSSNLCPKQSQKMHSLSENRITLRRVVSEGNVINEKTKNYYKKGVLCRQVVEERKSNPNLMNSVIEEAASKLVQMRKSKVKALVGAFESVIKIQDCGSSRTS
ncbi:hypothetical protein CDL12_03442 [Handroanthus impetiginosus]|uniref:Calmodulin-binding domain-containing protein n=1 Tax=Handroanthus impetiginosus TaxID=429701 RepID=A0A2G9I2K9_9LAMI|nr:hypothetical protein CDL12_03442 [Handroanthus impetiginosus]